MTGRWMNTSGSRIVLLEVKVKRTKNKGEGKKQQQTQTNNNIGHNTTPWKYVLFFEEKVDTLVCVADK